MDIYYDRICIMEIRMEEIMKKYSTTFIECVKEWPENIQEDIYKLYSYLRVVDEMVEGGDLFNTKEWER